MSEFTAYLNGEFIPDSECKIHVWDRGVRAGDAVFDVARTFNGKVFRLREHLERLYRSAKYANIEPGITVTEMEELALEVLKRNEPLREPGGDSFVLKFLTRGPWARITEKVPTTVGISMRSIDFTRFAHHYQTGARVIIPSTRSYPPQSLDPKVKHFSRMNFSLAELEVAAVDTEALPLLLDLDGKITENIGGNFFIVSKGVLRTPTTRNILQGISRMTAMELADQLGITTVEEDLDPYDAYTADEAFMTTTSYCILPVSHINNRVIGLEVPGPITRGLQAAWSEMVGVDIVEQALSFDPEYDPTRHY